MGQRRSKLHHSRLQNRVNGKIRVAGLYSPSLLPLSHQREASSPSQPLAGTPDHDSDSDWTTDESEQHLHHQRAFLATRHQGEAVRPSSRPLTPGSTSSDSTSEDSLDRVAYNRWIASYRLSNL